MNGEPSQFRRKNVLWMTVVVTLALLLSSLGSNVEELTLAASRIVAPEPAVILTTKVSVIDPPEARLGAVQVMLPLRPLPALCRNHR
jgi:hypothetical protein